VPVIFYCPSDSTLRGRRNAIAQQSDIFPSILGYLGYDKPVISFGQNLFGTTDQETWAANCQNGMYMYYKGEWLIKFDGEHVTGLYAYRTDPALRNNLLGNHPDTEKQMETELKAIIQQYMLHMTSRELVVTPDQDQS
jgi:hypothetical protein